MNALPREGGDGLPRAREIDGSGKSPLDKRKRLRYLLTMKRHNCNRMGGGREWAMCSSCDGRIHFAECTTKRNPRKDCCLDRHKILYAAGETRGRYDASLPMWKEGMKDWSHR